MGRKLPECFLWFCFLEGGDKSFSSHWSSTCQTRNCGFLLSLFFFCFKRFCTPSLTLGRNATGGWGGGRSLISQSLRQRDLPSDLGGFSRGPHMKSRMLRGICNTVLLENKQ